MKYYIIIFSLFLSFQSASQTTVDLVSCLELIFDQREFEPAFQSDLTTNGSLIIQTPKSNFRQPLEPTYTQRIRELRQEDFHASKHRVKVIREEEFEYSGIAEHAILQINASGDDRLAKFVIWTTVTDERRQYQWTYTLVKEQKEWKVQKYGLTKSVGQLSPR